MARPAAAGNGGVNWRPPAPGPVGPPPLRPQPRTQHPDFAPSAPERPSKRKWWILAGVAVVLLVAVFGYLVRPHSAGPATQACGQNVLPFNGLNFRLSPGGVAVDSSGAVYVTNQGMYGRVVKLTPGSSTPTVLPFTGLYQPQAVAVDSAGAVYVTDFNNRVVMLPAGSNNQTAAAVHRPQLPRGRRAG